MAITRETLRLVARMRVQIDQITDDVSRNLTIAWVHAWDDLLQLFLAAALDLVTLGAGGWPARRQVLRASRTVFALDQAGMALNKLAAQLRADAAEGARQAAVISAEGQGDIVASQLPYGSTLAQQTRQQRHQANAIDAIVRRSAEQITASSRYLQPDAVEAMKRELVRGVVLGDNPREAAAAMVDRVEGQFNGGLTRANTIARTEILDSSRKAAEVSQAGRDDVLDGWIWHAAVTGPPRTRTCPSCWAKHGTLHPLSEPGPLDHHQGRCSRTPKTKAWVALGFTVDEPDDALPDAEAIFKGLPRDEQLQIMGPARLALLDSGDIAWADLSTRRSTTGWRDSYHVTPVTDLTTPGEA